MKNVKKVKLGGDRTELWPTICLFRQCRTKSLRKKVFLFGVIMVRIFPAFSRIWTEYGKIRSTAQMRENVRKIWTRVTPNIDTFYAVNIWSKVKKFSKNWHNYRKLCYLFWRTSLLLLPKFNFWKGDFTLGYVSNLIWDFD